MEKKKLRPNNTTLEPTGIAPSVLDDFGFINILEFLKLAHDARGSALDR